MSNQAATDRQPTRYALRGATARKTISLNLPKRQIDYLRSLQGITGESMSLTVEKVIDRAVRGDVLEQKAS